MWEWKYVCIVIKKNKEISCLLLIALCATFIYFLQSAVKQSVKGVVIDGPHSPNEYVLPGTLPAVLFAWLFYTWWAWISRDKEALTKVEQTTQTTSISSHRTPLSPTPSGHFRSPSKPFPSQQQPLSGLGDERGTGTGIREVSVSADASVVIAAGGSTDVEANALPKFEEIRQRPHDNNGGEEAERLLSSSNSMASSHRVSPLQPSIDLGVDHIELSQLSSSRDSNSGRGDPSAEPTEESPSKAVASRRIFNPYLHPDAPISEGEDENSELWSLIPVTMRIVQLSISIYELS